MSIRTVVRAIHDLERAGLLDVTRFRGRTRTNRYRLLVPPGKGDTGVTFSGLRALGITLGITPEKVTHATVKGDTGVTQSSYEIEALTRGRAPAPAPARPRARAREKNPRIEGMGS